MYARQESEISVGKKFTRGDKVSFPTCVFQVMPGSNSFETRPRVTSCAARDSHRFYCANLFLISRTPVLKPLR